MPSWTPGRTDAALISPAADHGPRPEANYRASHADRNLRLNKLGRCVLMADDVWRVHISAQYSCVLVIFILVSISASQIFNSLAQTLFPLKLKTRRAVILW
jgi:hypothetical protein